MPGVNPPGSMAFPAEWQRTLARLQALETKQSSESTVSVLPTTGLVDGLVIKYQNAYMATNGIVWTLRWSQVRTRWETDGNDLVPSNNGALVGNITTSSAGAIDMTSGPTLTLPLAGAYELWLQNVAIVSTNGLAQTLIYNNSAVYTGVAGASQTGWLQQMAMGYWTAAAGEILNLKVYNANSISTQFLQGSIRAKLIHT